LTSCALLGMKLAANVQQWVVTISTRNGIGSPKKECWEAKKEEEVKEMIQQTNWATGNELDHATTRLQGQKIIAKVSIQAKPQKISRSKYVLRKGPQFVKYTIQKLQTVCPLELVEKYTTFKDISATPIVSKRPEQPHHSNVIA
jgi:hypothetical protein